MSRLSCKSTLQKAASSRSFASTSRRPIELASTGPSASTSNRSEEAPRAHLGPLAAKDPFLYDALRPQSHSSFAALAHRLKLISHKTDSQTQRLRIEALVQACTHPSFAKAVEEAKKYGEGAEVGSGSGIVRNDEGGKASPMDRTYRQVDGQYMEISAIKHNETLTALGNSMLGLLASEFLHLRYPNLPNRVFKAALSAFVGPNTLADVASELGIAAKGIVRWERRANIKFDDLPPGQRAAKIREMNRQLELQERKRNLKKGSALEEEPYSKMLSRDVHADALRSIIAVIFQEQVSLPRLLQCSSLTL
jgi:large subunit ribosomal protein L44